LIVTVVWVAVITAGCGKRLYPVYGKVTFEDGKPLAKGMIVFEGNIGESVVMARGMVQPDGSYQLSTYKQGDGVPPGRYRALINPMDLSDVPDEMKNLPMDIKYLKFETSGLEFDVGPGKNEIAIPVTRPRKPRR
jgi:hypothetical protein